MSQTQPTPSVSNCLVKSQQCLDLQGSGNTSQTLGKKRQNLGKKWCFTFNNYDLSHISSLEMKFRDLQVLYIFGKEIGESGTPHLQGYIESTKRIRPIEFFGLPKEIHWEKAKQPRENNIRYCSKDGNFYTNFKNIEIYKDKYDGSDLPTSWSSSQEAVINHIINTEPNDRNISYVFGGFGTGKSKICKYLCYRYKASLVYGTNRDALFSITGKERIICINIPKKGNINWSLIEQIKDGMFYSSKYEGRMILMKPPHLVIFTNLSPDTISESDIDKKRLQIFEVCNHIA